VQKAACVATAPNDLGIAFIMRGVVTFASQGITYTTREEMIELGPL
jgi:hypothetical protein